MVASNALMNQSRSLAKEEFTNAKLSPSQQSKSQMTLKLCNLSTSQQ